MTAPQNTPTDSSSSSSSPARPRVGQVVAYSHPDPFHPQGKPLTGYGVVLVVPSDQDAAVTLAPLSELHLLVSPDALQATKASDVPTSIAQPEPADG